MPRWTHGLCTIETKLLADKIEFIYVNGDHTLNALQQPKDTWMVKTIEPIFRKMMFGS